MVNILMFGMSSYPGGIENYLRNVFLTKECSEKIHIDFVSYEDSIAYYDELMELGYNVIFVPHLKRQPVGYFKSVLRLFKNNYDAVYINMLSAANPIPVFLAKKNRIKNIILHAHSNSTLKGILRNLFHHISKKYCDKAADKRLACSNEAAEWLFNLNNKNNDVVIIPNAINVDKHIFSDKDRDEIRAKYLIEDNEVLLGSVGRLGPEKNNLFMIDILKDLIDKNVPAKLMLIGEGVMREKIQEKVAEYNLSDKVIMTGTIINPECYYSAFDCFLFPSLFEGFGIAALEAQSAGLKCLCSDTLSKQLDVTNTIEYLPIDKGVNCWSEYIISNNLKFNRNLMNKTVAQSDFNIKSQRSKILELIYE